MLRKINGLVSKTFTLEQKSGFKLERNKDLTFIVIIIDIDSCMKIIIVIIFWAISPSPSQGTHLHSVGRLIVVGDQAYHRCVIGKFDDDVRAVCGCTVVCVQGVQEWAEDIALRSTSVDDQRR